jgi:peptide deformylase
MQLSIIPNEQTPAIPEMDVNWLEDQGNIKILYEFLHFIENLPTAVGMAANQIAVDGERIMLPFFMSKASGKWEVFCNPKITNRYGVSKEMTEICLSWEGKKILATRHDEIEAEWYALDKDGLSCRKQKMTGFKAQVFQHEIDHLMGVPEIIVPWDYMTVRNGVKIGRNDPCQCGSGKKSKKCCG